MIKNIKSLLFFCVFISLFTVFVQKTNADCTIYESGGPDAQQGEECYLDNGGQVAGRSEFSCANYDTQFYKGYGCYWNRYTCDGTTCAGGGGGGGGGGGTCQNPQAVGINCPAGTVKSTTLISSLCVNRRYCAGPGTAQSEGTCCYYVDPPEECSDWYCGNETGPEGKACGFKANGQEKCCKDCTDEPGYCANNYIDTYECVSTCSSTAPSASSLLTPTNGATLSSTSVSLNWTTPTSWGTGCPSNNNQFEVFIGTSVGSMASAGSVSSSVLSMPFNGTSGQTYYWRVRTKNGSLNTDSAIGSFTINIYVTPWWQVKDGDVMTNASLSSVVPTGQLFGTVGLGTFPGVPVFSTTFNLTADTSKISSTAWNVNTQTSQSRIFNFGYFDNLIPEDVVFNNISDLQTGGTQYTDGYEWFRVNGNLSISSDINFGNRKVILFVENGDLGINENITLNDGIGFFGAFVEGNIAIAPTVTGTPSIEGIYQSNGSFSTGSGSTPLHLRGSIASFGGVSLQRDLTLNNQPAEIFEFAPDQILLFPEKLMFKRSKWAEVAP